MRWLTKLGQWLTKASPWIGYSLGRREIPPERQMQNYLDAYVSWTYACARVISENVAQVPFRLYYRTRKGTEELIKDHPALDLLSECNPWMTEFEVRELTSMHLELVGEAYWAMEFNRLGKPGEIWPLMPQYTFLLPSKTQFLDGFEYRVPHGDVIHYGADEVVQFKYSHPSNQYRGWSPTRAAGLAIDIHQFAQEWVRNFFYNDATPSGILSSDQPVTQTQADTIRAMWNEGHQGRGRAHRMAVVGLGTKFQSIDRSLSELAFTPEQQRIRDDILGMYGVPKSILGISDDVNRANAEAGEYVFALRVIKPRLKRIEQRLTEFLVQRHFDEKLFLRFDDPVPQNRAILRAEADTGIKSGILTVNEARRKLGESEIDTGHVLYVPLNMAQVKVEDLGKPLPTAVPPPPAPLPPADNPPSDQPPPADQPPPDVIIPTPQVPAKQLEPLERRLTATLQRFFQWRQSQVRDRLKQHSKALVKAYTNPSVFLWDDDSAIARAIVPCLHGLIMAGPAQGPIGLEHICFPSEAAVSAVVDDQLGALQGLDDRVRAAVGRAIHHGIASGESLPLLTDSVSAVFADAKGVWATETAQSIVRRLWLTAAQESPKKESEGS